MNDLTIYEATRALVTPQRGNYVIQCGNSQIVLKRGVDFDNPIVKKTGKKAFDKPILKKEGAEAIAFGYGLLQHYVMETKIEDHVNHFYMYTVRCDLVKLVPGVGLVVVSNYHGSANTAESRNGFQSGDNSANGTLKMAHKRALVGAALAISGLSGLFYQDIDNDGFMDGSKAITTESPDDPITPKQIQRIYAIAADAGLNTEQAKTKIKALGFASTKDIKQKDYDKVCDEIRRV